MLNICSDYGDDYGVSYNTQKTVCLEISKNKVPDYCAVYLGKNELTWVQSVKYLGIHITNNLCDSKDIKIKRGNFFASVNSLIGNFKDLPSCVINDLFSSYCCSFYGSQCWSFRNKDIQCIYTVFNKSLRRIWNLPPISRTKYVLLVARRKCLEKQFIIKFLNMLESMYRSDNVVVAYIARNAFTNFETFIGKNIAYVRDRYGDYYKDSIFSLVKSLYVCTSFSEDDKAVTDCIRDCINYIDGRISIPQLSVEEAKDIVVNLSTS